MHTKSLSLAVVSLVVGVTVEAGKPLPSPEKNVVGYGQNLVIVPDLGDGVRMGGELVWSDMVQIKDATLWAVGLRHEAFHAAYTGWNYWQKLKEAGGQGFTIL